MGIGVIELGIPGAIVQWGELAIVEEELAECECHFAIQAVIIWEERERT